MSAAPDLLLDVRGLEPPEPLVRVLGALEDLAPDRRLKLVIDLEPRPLYLILKSSGYGYEAQATPAGAFEILIWRNT